MAQQYASNWHLWCRLCAKDDVQGNINVFLKNEQFPGDALSSFSSAAAGSDLELATAIGKYFWVNITRGGDLPEMICTDCLPVVTSLVNFSKRITRVQKLYYVLQNMSKQEQINIDELRIRFGIQDDNRTPLLPHQSLTEEHYVDEKPKLNEQGLLEDTFELQNPLSPCFLNQNEVITKKSNALKNYTTEELLDEDTEEQLEEDEELEEDNYNAFADDDTASEFSGATSDDSQRPANQKQRPRSLKKHKEKSHQCTECPRAYAHLTTLTRHIRREHQNSKELFICKECDKEFCSRFSLDRHMQSHVPVFNRKVHPCEICGKKFTSPASVRSHYQYMHQDIRPARPIICEQCGVSVHSNSSLKEHMLCHTDETPFECDECKKCFKSASRLKHHKETHDPHKHICPECGMQLNSRATLNRHRLVHTDQMQHKCDYCGKAFKRAKALKNHLILHTGLKPYSCDFCERTFATGSNCRTHKRKTHPEELAAQEAAGGVKTVNRNIPNLATLKAFTKNKDNLSPVASKQSGCFAFGKKPRPIKVTMVNEAEAETNTTAAPTVSSIPTIDNIYNHILKQTAATAEKKLLSSSFGTQQIIPMPTESGAPNIEANSPTESTSQFNY